MAVQSRSTMNSGSGNNARNGATVNMNMNTTASDENARREETFIDVFSKDAPQGEARRLDITDPLAAFKSGAPPAKGLYSLRLTPAGQKTFTIHQVDENDETKGVYYKANLECRVVSEDKEVDNFPVFANVTTRIGRGKDCSTMAALIALAGFSPIPKGKAEVSDLEVCQMLSKVMAKEPVLHNTVLDWTAGYFDGKKWINVCQTMEDFPKLDASTYNHEVQITKANGSRESLRANLRVIEWGSAKAVPVQQQQQKKAVASAPKPVSASRVSAPAPVEEVINDAVDLTEDDLMQL